MPNISPQILDDPHVDPDYVGSDKEMEDDVDDTHIENTEANTDVDDDDHDHDGDDDDDMVVGSIQSHS